MAYAYQLPLSLNLYVKGRIADTDAERQTVTAKEILTRLEQQPGLILADEVGMGKTFVALAIASAIAAKERRRPVGKRRPVVVMVPRSVRDKWLRDIKSFNGHCLEAQDRLMACSADNGVEFLKRLDEAEHGICSVIVLTHGAMSTRLGDAWVKLALIWRALRFKKNVGDLRVAVERFVAKLLRLEWAEKRSPGVLAELLSTQPFNWAKCLAKRGLDPENENNPSTDRPPVPKAILEVIDDLNTNKLFDQLDNLLPRRVSVNIEENLKLARAAVEEQVRLLWIECLQKFNDKLPLLILDEAHHLKNPGTNLASLFQSEEAKSDIQAVTRGALAGVFERMLFLTATPFQLGHHELCNVLDRFGGIYWRGAHAPQIGEKEFTQKVIDLRTSLDSAQVAGIRLDEAWGKLNTANLKIGDQSYADADTWWEAVDKAENIDGHAQIVQSRVRIAAGAFATAGEALRPWVIRHTRSAFLPNTKQLVARRKRIIGRGIAALSEDEEGMTDEGLSISGNALLPFLLSSRLVAVTPESRPVFSEGLSSSFEAFLDTRLARADGTHSESAHIDEDDGAPTQTDISPEAEWYLDQIRDSIRSQSGLRSENHPKIAATVDRTMALWAAGEKVVVFCHYIATGRALRAHLSDRMNREVIRLAATKLNCPSDAVERELEKMARRFDKGERVARHCGKYLDKLLDPWKNLNEHRERIHDIVLRFLRTPSFLVRFAGTEWDKNGQEGVHAAFNSHDASGLTLSLLLHEFFRFLDDREERSEYLYALNKIQTGSHSGKESLSSFESDETSAKEAGALVANVRLINGRTKQDTRQKLMLAFNTPFYPEILIASSVLAEGVDLHLNCRHIIHHDLCWNPSTLEQRTGRVDRIGAKAEQAGKSIYVYLPYVGGTQDEKLYRVVMDRERWFSIVMNGAAIAQEQMTARNSDHLAERLLLPDAIRNILTLKLNVVSG